MDEDLLFCIRHFLEVTERDLRIPVCFSNSGYQDNQNPVPWTRSEIFCKNVYEPLRYAQRAHLRRKIWRPACFAYWEPQAEQGRETPGLRRLSVPGPALWLGCSD
ncbi:hypothetical protein CEXT_323641 [Caerostris extrusa]|uniref:Uncharacterized protein n=1 Tax=Caerostris extrusa TaxID=172846 RepID=A0AAV4VHH2_CAEEX|nr:hypothetical protein CEXT_323641 [Caerostris extrusa]